jgi:SAM-dependent methyltransferase
MQDADKNRIISRYNERLTKFGPSIEALASGNEERRNMRFSVLKEIGISKGDSVLDLGCGFGDLYNFLKLQGLRVNYTGIDINPALIDHARKQYADAEFKVLDIQNEDPGKFDYIVSTSCFNLKLLNEDNYGFIENLMKRAYSFAKKGVAIDFLTSYVDFKGNPEEAFYYSPEKVFEISKSITKRVCLRHDYPLFEFCIYMYPDFKGWSEK